MTELGQVVRRLEDLLADARIPRPRFEAELIVADCLGVERSGVYARWTDSISREDEECADLRGRRRASREPMQYIRGRQEFYSIAFEVEPGVLIPRPETELLVDRALELMSSRSAPPRIADVGTGSGCLAVTLARHLPGALIWASDLSEKAVRLARRNAELAAVQVQFAICDLLSAREPAALLDLIVSNPPYLPLGDRDQLQPEILLHEPSQALFAGDDGLDVVRRLISQAGRQLAPGGWFLMEMARNQEEAVAALLIRAGFKDVNIGKDLAGHDRMAEGRWPHQEGKES